jgi:hypothetical protein
MANALNRPDLMVNYKYDLVMAKDGDGNAEVVRTNTVSGSHTLAQSLYLVVESSLGGFALRSGFGASPKVFHGRAMTAALFPEMETYIINSIKRSGVNQDGLPIRAKVVPISRNMIAVQVAISNPRNPNEIVAGIKMLYNSTDNTVSPMYSGYQN